MSPIFHRTFKKSFKKLSLKQQKSFYERLRLFEENPYDDILKNHALSGKYTDCRSINVSGDIRAIYTIYVIEHDEIVFIDIGTHSELYK